MRLLLKYLVLNKSHQEYKKLEADSIEKTTELEELLPTIAVSTNQDADVVIGTAYSGNKVETSSGACYFQIIPDSHFYTDLYQLLNTVENIHFKSVEEMVNHLAVGIRNTIKAGYILSK